jgi:hypothetical protein
VNGVSSSVALPAPNDTAFLGFTDNGPISVTFSVPSGFELDVPTFFASAGVPEPDVWAMMMLGLFGAGALLRRRRRRSAALA